MNDKQKYENAVAAFNEIKPGDRVRVVEEFTVESVQDGILVYRADEAVKHVENAERFEYWPSEHTVSLSILVPPGGQI